MYDARVTYTDSNTHADTFLPLRAPPNRGCVAPRVRARAACCGLVSFLRLTVTALAAGCFRRMRRRSACVPPVAQRANPRHVDDASSETHYAAFVHAANSRARVATRRRVA